MLNKKTKKKDSSNVNDKSLAIKRAIRKMNPDPFHFNKQSCFIYQPILSNIYYNKLKNKNLMKPSNQEMMIFNNISIQFEKKREDVIMVLPFFKELMENVVKVKPSFNKRDILIQTLIKSSPKNHNISIEKITNEFNSIAEKKGLKKIGKSTMHTIFRKKFHLVFKKKTIKNKNLITKNFIKYSFFFIKIVARSMSLGLKFIYIDESGFSLSNNNFKSWFFKDEEIYYGSNLKSRINLILGVTDNKVIHYQVNKENTTSAIFKSFMDELVGKIDQDEKEDYVFILDNFAGHLTAELFELYKYNKIKVLFGVPYASNFNMVENVFRLIKNKTYKRIYNSIDILKNDIVAILNDNNTKLTLKKLFNETIREYIKFIEKNKHFNLDL